MRLGTKAATSHVSTHAPSLDWPNWRERTQQSPSTVHSGSSASVARWSTYPCEAGNMGLRGITCVICQGSLCKSAPHARAQLGTQYFKGVHEDWAGQPPEASEPSRGAVRSRVAVLRAAARRDNDTTRCHPAWASIRVEEASRECSGEPKGPQARARWPADSESLEARASRTLELCVAGRSGAGNGASWGGGVL